MWGLTYSTADLPINRAKSYYIAENLWSWSIYACEKIKMLCQRKISNRSFKLKVKRSNERICLAISQSSGNKICLHYIIEKVLTSTPVFVFLKLVNKNRFYMHLKILRHRGQRSSGEKCRFLNTSEYSLVGCQIKDLFTQNPNMGLVFRFKYVLNDTLSWNIYYIFMYHIF